MTCNKYAPKILLLLSITYSEEQDTQLRRGGGEYSNIFINTKAKAIFRGLKISISVFFGGFREMNIFGGMKILWIFLGFIT